MKIFFFFLDEKYFNCSTNVKNIYIFKKVNKIKWNKSYYIYQTIMGLFVRAILFKHKNIILIVSNIMYIF